ncbi:MAG: hypothetical protein HY673_02995 [Chloroflexi bacterium]|nr:hypothetical protein [Chloroflexota bacterium]
MGSGIVEWLMQSGQPTYSLLVSTKDWMLKHPELVARLLNSLAQADDYLIRHPAEAKAIVQKHLNVDDSYMSKVWAEHQFTLSLDQSLIIAMEDEARWMIRNNLTAEKQVPNFLEYLYEDALKSVRPEAAKIIR